ncbi:MAG: methyltransferase domain-containing protein [Burkholderiaceae bacterium]
MNDFEPDGYFGTCSLCGTFQEFERALRSIRETYRCRECKALLREREQAQALLSCFTGLGAASMAELVRKPEFRRLRIYEPGTIGPFRKLFQGLAFYQQSSYYPQSERAQATKKLPHQSLEALDFADASFDLVITSDIMEHVRKPELALREIHRVLKPDGYHVFTVPLQDPLSARSVSRVDTSGETDRAILPENFHGDGRGGKALVYTDFGADIVDMLVRCGFSAALRRTISGSAQANRIYTVVSRRT